MEQLIGTIGYLGIYAVVFAESGLLIGFFLPGDSLLFTAGFLASKGILNIWILAIGCFIAAVIGDSFGYAFGKRVGRRLFNRENSVFFHKDNLKKAEKFYEEHGKKTIIISRFIPVIRTFAPIVAGMGDMHYTTFLSYNLVGGFLWSVGMCVAGYVSGNLIPGIENYLFPLIIVFIVLSLIPTFKELIWNDPQVRYKIFPFLRKK